MEGRWQNRYSQRTKLMGKWEKEDRDNGKVRQAKLIGTEVNRMYT